MNELSSLITNTISRDGESRYAGIVGLNPSKGAKSPVLWNNVYHSLNSHTRMFPLDVGENNLEQLLRYLEADLRFIGGSIAAPHKIRLCNLLWDNLAPEARSIGAINCLYRDQDGKLAGVNTDGEAALHSIRTLIGNSPVDTVLILGTGGTARAIAAYIRRLLSKKARVVIAYNTNKLNDADLEKFCIDEQISFNDVVKFVTDVDLLINATILGGQLAPGISPLPMDVIAHLPKTSFVFEVNYEPGSSTLIEFAEKQQLKNMNGRLMNLWQAVFAFQYVNAAIADCYGQDYIAKQMQRA